MNSKIEKVTTATGEVKHEVRVWHRGRGAKQVKRRFDTRKEAGDFLDQLIKDEKESGKTDVASKTFGPEYRNWRAENDSDFAPGWKSNLDSYWAECKPKLESARLDRLEPIVTELKQWWAEKGLTQKTINNKAGFIYAVLNFSVEEKRITHNPLGKFKKPRRQLPDIEFLERAEAESLLDFFNSKYPKGSKLRWRHVAILTVMNTAVRAGETWALRPADFKPSLGSIRVARQINRVTHAFADLKGKKARSVPLNESLLTEVNEIAPSKKADLLFGGGKAVDHDTFCDQFDKDIKEWGGTRITFHGLRHTAATLMLLSGVDVKSLQEIMGHADIATTMRYVHAVGDSAKRAGQVFQVGPKPLSDFGGLR